MRNPPPAVILAAGKATRMRPYSEEVPKTLFELLPGLTVMDLILRMLEDEGIEDIVIVTRPSLAKHFEMRYGDKVRIVTTDMEEGFGNLYTFLIGAKAVEGDDFLVLMSDHIFEAEILRRMLRSKEKKAFVLSLDRNPPWERLEEGLKVVLDGERIRSVGKGEVPYYGIDTGLFRCSLRSVEIARRVIRELGPGASIADALRTAIEMGEVSYVDVTGLLWLDVDTPEDLDEARRLLPALLRRSLVKPGDGPVSRYLNRPISTRISVWLFTKRIYVSPNLVSILAFLLAVAGSYLTVLGNLLAAAFLIHLSSVIDGVDGEVARLFRTASEFGKLFDAFLDRYADLAVVMGIAIAVDPSTFYHLVLSLLAAANVFVTSYVSHLAGWRSDVVQKFRTWSPASRDVRLFVTVLLMAFSLMELLLIYLAVVPLIFSAALVVATRVEKAPEKLEKRKPMPEVKVIRERRRATPVEARIRVLFSSSMKLVIVLLVLRSLSFLLADLGPVTVLDLSIHPVTILSILEFFAVVYYGYRILFSLRYFMELASSWLVRELGLVTEAAVKRALADLFYLFVLSILIYFVPKVIEELPLGRIASKVALVILLGFFLIFLYDFVKIFYRSLKDVLEKKLVGYLEAGKKE